MVLRHGKSTDRSLSVVRYEHGSRPTPQLFGLSKAMAEGECTALRLFLTLILIVGLIICATAIQMHGLESFLTTKIIGRTGNAAVLWMILISVLLGAVGFVAAIWYKGVRVRNRVEDMWELLPRATEIPVNIEIINEKMVTRYPYRASISADLNGVKISNLRWHILNSVTDRKGRYVDRDFQEWISNSHTRQFSGSVLVDSDGEPLCLIIDDRVLWLLTSRFLPEIDMSMYANAAAQLSDANKQMRYLLRTLPG